MAQITGGADDQVSGLEAAAVHVEQQVALEAAHCFLGAEDRLAERVIFPEILREDLMDQVVRIILVHLDLFEDDAPLTVDVLKVEDRIQDQVAQHIHCNRKVLVQDFDIETNAFLRSEGVHVAAD